MSIKDLSGRTVLTASGATTIRDIALLMKKKAVGCVVITQDGTAQTRATGIITDRDIVVNTVAQNHTPSESRADEIMSHNVFSITEDSGIAAALHQMRLRRVRRLLVIDNKGLPAGFVSLDDLTRMIAKETMDVAMVIDRQTSGAEESTLDFFVP